MAGWRRLYGSEWKHGAERVEIVKKKIESWGCGLVVTLGFMAESTQQVLAGMPNGHEMGEPDLEVLLKQTGFIAKHRNLWQGVVKMIRLNHHSLP